MFLSALAAADNGTLSAERFREVLRLPANPEEVARHVLSREEFRTSPVQSLVDRVAEFFVALLNALVSWLQDHWPRFGRIEGDYDFFWTFLGIFFYAVILGLLVSALIFVFIKLIRPALQRWTSRVFPDAGILPEQDEPGEPSRQEVLDLARQGNFRAALIRLFRSILIQLDSRGQLILHRSRTTREILNAFPSQEPVRETLADMITVFNAVRYGAAPCGRAEFERFAALADRVVGSR
jgi:hypothetical protein